MSARRWGVAAALCSVAVSVFAATPRTFVASYGSDANPCSVTSPCRSFNAALAQTSVGGEVIVLDSAGYGPMTITESVSIIAPTGVYAGITAFSGSAVTIDGATARIALKNLALNGLGADFGIFVVDASAVRIEACTIAAFPNAGIKFRAAGATLRVAHTLMRSNASGVSLGIVDTGLLITAEFDGNRIVLNSGPAIETGALVNVSVNRSILSMNDSGIFLGANTTQSPLYATVNRSLVSDNSNDGFDRLNFAIGSCRDVVSADNAITRNRTGIAFDMSGSCAPWAFVARDNVISQNALSGIAVAPFGATIVVDRNVISGNGTYALDASVGTIKTVRGADGLPNNAGEQTTPTTGNVVPVNPF